MKIPARTRYAPSPTGYMHVGNLRTALYEYLIAKSSGGQFILRIEDTDQARLMQGAEEAIYSTLKAAGLEHDEGPDVGGAYGPYVQSERKPLYLPHAQELVRRGAAYRCFCAKERLAALGSGGHGEHGGHDGYDGRCRGIPADEAQSRAASGEPHVIRQKMPRDGGSTSFHDAVYGTVTIQNSELEDQVLVKSDGLPTYNFANVVDDHLMAITHVVRGSEYLTSTPKYVLLYEAFGWEQPVYVHLPAVTKEGGKKLSKREGDPSFLDLLAMGFLPEAVVNYIALLGWSPGGTRERFSLAELAEAFTLEGISKSPSTFDNAKLRHFNAEYLRGMDEGAFCEAAAPYIRRAVGGGGATDGGATDGGATDGGATDGGKFDISLIAKTLHQRTEALGDIADGGALDFYAAMPEYGLDLYTHKKMKTDIGVARTSVRAALEALSGLAPGSWDHDGIHDALAGLAAPLGMKNSQIMWPVRVAITGKAATPGGAVEIAQILGQAQTLRRLEAAAARLGGGDGGGSGGGAAECTTDAPSQALALGLPDAALTPALAEKLASRPSFPERAIITGGMPYGNKGLHFGHIGGYFVHADALARFLRDRIGAGNVLFLSGTDCYGSPIAEDYRKKRESGDFAGGIQEFVEANHASQKETLDRYMVSLDFYGGSSIGRAAEIHRGITDHVIRTLHANGHLEKLTTAQFYDAGLGVFLNGRQVVGRCPVAGCQSEKGYADECDLGHQYPPADLIAPRSELSGLAPEMRDATNWYVRMDAFRGLLGEWLSELSHRPGARPFMARSIAEFLEPPAIYFKREWLPQLAALTLPDYSLADDGKSQSAKLVFASLADREAACAAMAGAGLNYRTGKTLVPFRLTGNIEWGVPAPEIDGLGGLTVWVWPESLWAPISFTQAALEGRAAALGAGAASEGAASEGAAPPDAWKSWWHSRGTRVYQFIGQDNIYFYGPAQSAIFMGMQGPSPSASPKDGDLPLTDIIASNHILFMNKKASSSGKVKPPMARDLLDHYTPEQLRAHFLGLGLGIRSVSFQPKPLDPNAAPADADPALKEGNMLTNVLNRVARSCFYTAQKYTGGALPGTAVSDEAASVAAEAALDYEQLMARCEFHQMMNLLDTYIRGINKMWAKNMKDADARGDEALRLQTLADAFHMLRVAVVLVRPVAPQGAGMVAEYFGVPAGMFFDWANIFQPPSFFVGRGGAAASGAGSSGASASGAAAPAGHAFKFLEPRTDFFPRHPSQTQ